MGRHTGPAVETTRREFTIYALGVIASFAVWIALVVFAIKLGSPAKEGSLAAWFLLAVASLGAIVCLVLSILLTTRAWEFRTGVRRPRAPAAGPGGGHRHLK